MKPEAWVSLSDIAEHLQVSTDTVHRWIRARKIPVHRVGRFWRFQVSEIDEWVRAGKAAGKKPAEGSGAGAAEN
jgi:excisionase family DNA binding protein